MGLTQYVVKVTYLKGTEDGKIKRESDFYVTDAMSFTEAESIIIKEKASIYDELEVEAMTKDPFEAILATNGDEDVFYRFVIKLLTLDEVSGKVKKIQTAYLVQGKDLNDAKAKMEAFINKGNTFDWEYYMIRETKIIEYIPNHEERKHPDITDSSND